MGSVIKELSDKGIKLNITAVYTFEQVKKIYKKLNKKTKSIISIFAGRMADKGKDPIPIFRRSIFLTKRNKNIDGITENNYQMAGWPVNSLDKYVDILLNNKYTVVIVEQFDNEMGGNAKKDRKVTDILSPTTTITNVADYNSKFLMSIYFYKFDQSFKQLTEFCTKKETFMKKEFCIDFVYHTYKRHLGNRSHALAYLSWEKDLLNQMDDEEINRFKVL